VGCASLSSPYGDFWGHRRGTPGDSGARRESVDEATDWVARVTDRVKNVLEPSAEHLYFTSGDVQDSIALLGGRAREALVRQEPVLLQQLDEDDETSATVAVQYGEPPIMLELTQFLLTNLLPFLGTVPTEELRRNGNTNLLG